MNQLRVDEQVWLRPRTLGCSAVCWSQPRVTVVGHRPPGVTVRLPDDREIDVHEDNVTRTRSVTAKTAKKTPRKPMVDAEEVPLW